MIAKMLIQDYRSCINTTFTPHPHLSVLIGPNSSGKTNVLNAILLLQRLIREREGLYHEPEEPTSQCKLKVWFELEEKTAIFNAAVDIFTDDHNHDVVLSSSQHWYAWDFTKSKRHVHVPLWMCTVLGQGPRAPRAVSLSLRQWHLFRKAMATDIPEALAEPLAQIAASLTAMRYYSASQFTNPANCPVSFETEEDAGRRRATRLRGHAKFLFDLYESYRERAKTRYDDFFDIVGPNGIGLVDAIDFQEIPTSSVEYAVRSGGRVKRRKREKILIIPKFQIGSNQLSPNQLSEGTFKTITLLFYLITERSQLLLLEEPEVCVHHGLLSSIIELVKEYSKNKQIVVSTHSDFVLDHVEPANVYKVGSTAKGTEVANVPKSMSRAEFAALRKYLAQEGNLGEYWRHGGLDS